MTVSLQDTLLLRLEHALTTAQVPRGVRLTLALSGGVDSVALLHLLHFLSPRWPFDLAAVHVNHHLQQEADTWEKLCVDLCQRLNVPCQLHHVQVTRHAASLEADARKARYQALATTGAWVVLAHHQNDQAETVLLNLLRGAGVRGAAAMPLSRQDGAVTYLRPLLATRRDELLAVAKAKGWVWAEDPTNYSEDYRRSRLRHEIVPAITQVFPQAVASLSRSAEHFQVVDGLLDDLARMDWHQCAPSAWLDLQLWRSLSEERRSNLLRHLWLWRGLPPPARAQLIEGQRQFLIGDGSLLCGSLVLRSYQQRLYMEPVSADSDSAIEPCQWHGQSEMAWGRGRLIFARATGSGIRATMAKNVFIRHRQGGERIALHHRQPHRNLKYIFQQQKVPPWQRAQWPLIFSDTNLLAVAGLAISREALCSPGEIGWQIAWHPHPEVPHG